MGQWSTGTSIAVVGGELVVAKRRRGSNRSDRPRGKPREPAEVTRATEAEARWLLAARGEAVVAVRRVDPDTGVLVTALAGQHTLRTVTHPSASAALVLRRVAVTVGRLHRLGLVHGRLTLDHVVLTGPRLDEPVLCSPEPSPLTQPGRPATPPEVDLVALAAMAAKLKPSPGRAARRWQRTIDELQRRGPRLGPTGAAELFDRLA